MKVKFLLCLCIIGIAFSRAESVSVLYQKAREHSRKGELPKAIACFEDILRDLPAGRIFDEDRCAYALPYTNILLLMGRYHDVEEILGTRPYCDDVALLINLAAAYGYQNKYEEADSVLNGLLEKGVNREYETRIYHNKGFMELQQKNYSVAEENLKIAADRLEGMEKEIANSNRAVALAYLNRHAEALNLINSALENLGGMDPGAHRDYLKVLRKKAEILQINGDNKGALREYKTYFKYEKAWLAENLNQMSRSARLALWGSEKDLLSKCFSLEEDADFIYEVAMYRRLTSLLGMQDLSELLRLTDITPLKIKQSLHPDETAVEFISYVDLDGEEKYAAVMLSGKGQAKFIPICEAKEFYKEGKVATRSIYSLIQSSQPQDKNLLYSSEGVGNLIWLPILSSLPKGIKRIYFAPEGIFHLWGIENMPFDGKEDVELRRVSSTALIAAKRPEKKSGGSQLLIGGLNYSNMPENKGEGDFEFNREASRLLEERAGRTDVFTFLPGTRTEVDSIKKIRPEATLRYSISEEELKKEMPRYASLHIATHGYALSTGLEGWRSLPVDYLKVDDMVCLTDTLGFNQSLEACGIALSGANVSSQFPDREDALLSAREICDLNLNTLDFVVLSACQTALGDVVDEGGAGLVRGLKNAGANTVMASLWSVDDESTMIFMTEFYRLLNCGKTKREAYILAQNHLKTHIKKIKRKLFSAKTLSSHKNDKIIEIKYDAPYYWAPFILIDDF